MEIALIMYVAASIGLIVYVGGAIAFAWLGTSRQEKRGPHGPDDDADIHPRGEHEQADLTATARRKVTD